jgi:hypothetical protein
MNTELKPTIPVLRRLRQKDQEVEAKLDYTVRPCLKKQTITVRQN